MDSLQNIKDALYRNPLVSFSYLFGSRASNKSGNMSDWDIAVYLNDDKMENNPVWQKIGLENELSSALKTDKIQVAVLNNLDAPLLAFNIVKDGILLTDKDTELRIGYECATLRRFHDWRYYLDRHMIADGCMK